MTSLVENLELEALKLPEKERAHLARVLLLSLDDSHDHDDEIAWAEEAERRYQELKAGTVQAVPSEVVFEQARARLR